jgi:hypothetical protein
MSYVNGSLRCDMTHDCADPVSRIDRKGYVYCAKDQPCRRLRPHEIKKLAAGQPLPHY